MPRFLLISSNGLDWPMSVAAKSMFESVANEKQPDIKSTTKEETWRRTDYVDWLDYQRQHNVLHVKTPSTLAESIGVHPCITSVILDAKDELDAYYQMVMADHCFDLASIVSAWNDKPNPSNHRFSDPSTLVIRSILEQLDPDVRVEISAYGNAEPGSLPAECRTWITPVLAKQMWLIYNDPRDLDVTLTGNDSASLSMHHAVPMRDRPNARLVPLDSIPSIVLKPVAPCLSPLPPEKKQKNNS